MQTQTAETTHDEQLNDYHDGPITDHVEDIDCEGDSIIIVFADGDIQDIPVAEVRRFGKSGGRVVLSLHRDPTDEDYGVQSTYWLTDPHNADSPDRIHDALRLAYHQAKGHANS